MAPRGTNTSGTEAPGTEADKPGTAAGAVDHPNPLNPTGDKSDPVIVTQGAASAAAIDAANGKAPVPPIPVEVPGPGAGALNVAVEAQGFATRPLDAESRDPTGGSRHAGETGLRDDRPFFGDVRTDLGRVPTLAGISPISAAFAASGAGGSVLDTARGAVDAALIKGERLVTAATNVLHNGTMYRSGEKFAVDFVGFTKLVEIGAVLAKRWHDLEEDV